MKKDKNIWENKKGRGIFPKILGSNSSFSLALKLNLAIALFFLLALSVSAAQSTKMGFQGYVTNTVGQPVSGNLMINISGTNDCSGNIYSETFTNGIVGGYFDVLLGETTSLNLNYNLDYYACTIINGEQVGNPQKFRGGQGEIATEDIASDTIINTDVSPTADINTSKIKHSGPNWLGQLLSDILESIKNNYYNITQLDNSHSHAAENITNEHWVNESGDTMTGTLTVQGEIKTSHLNASNITNNYFKGNTADATNLNAISITTNHLNATDITTNYLDGNDSQINRLRAQEVEINNTLKVSKYVGIGTSPYQDYFLRIDTGSAQSTTEYGIYSYLKYDGASDKTYSGEFANSYSGTNANPLVKGILATAFLSSTATTGKVYGVQGNADDSLGNNWASGTYDLYGVYGEVGSYADLNPGHTATITGYGIYGADRPAGGGSGFTYYAGYFDDNVAVNGNLTVNQRLTGMDYIIGKSGSDLRIYPASSNKDIYFNQYGGSGNVWFMNGSGGQLARVSSTGDFRAEGNLTAGINIKQGDNIIVNASGSLAMNKLQRNDFDTGEKGLAILGCGSGSTNCTTVCSNHGLACNRTSEGTSVFLTNCNSQCDPIKAQFCWCE